MSRRESPDVIRSSGLAMYDPLAGRPRGEDDGASAQTSIGSEGVRGSCRRVGVSKNNTVWRWRRVLAGLMWASEGRKGTQRPEIFMKGLV